MTPKIKIIEDKNIELIETKVNNFLTSEINNKRYHDVDIKVTSDNEGALWYTVILKLIEEN